MINTNEIVTALIAERDRLNAAIAALTGPTKRRGRPPKNGLHASTNGVTALTSTPALVKKTSRVFTAAQRKKHSARMKAFWAAKKRAK
jgi:hypothetical protein